MQTFANIIEKYTWQQIRDQVYSVTSTDVERALHANKRGVREFMALISPAAENYIEEMAQRCRQETLRRYGNVIHMYVPMYLSNECQNICTYCGFSLGNKIPRKTLSDEEIIKEAIAIRSQGFEHILLVTGEANHTVSVPYFKNALKILKPYFSQVSIEVQPLEENEYKELSGHGVHSVLVYQETYNRERYKEFHPKGKKSNYQYRLETPDRIGKAGMHKIGLGVLLGLDDWRIENYFMAMHLGWLQKNYWKTRYSVSFPRLRPFSGGEFTPFPFSDKNLVQLISAYRLLNPELELSLSTREPQKLRDKLFGLGINSVSAGSKTNPGGYSVDANSLEQFEIDDQRTPAQVAKAIKTAGYEPVWKDWDPVLSNA
ncbi:MAG: 2-iminoacetate synthase ThiH [Flavobacteriales bacterium]